MNFLPISPAASCGIIHIAVAISSTLLASLVSYFVEDHVWYSLAAMGASNLLGIMTGLFVKETIDKSKKEMVH